MTECSYCSNPGCTGAYGDSESPEMETLTIEVRVSTSLLEEISPAVADLVAEEARRAAHRLIMARSSR